LAEVSSGRARSGSTSTPALRAAEFEGYVLEAIRKSPGVTANRAIRGKGALDRRRGRLYSAG
jgi:hypothetical protein